MQNYKLQNILLCCRSLSNKELIELVIMHLESIEKPGKNIVIDCKDVDFLELNHHVEEIIISGALTVSLLRLCYILQGEPPLFFHMIVLFFYCSCH